MRTLLSAGLYAGRLANNFQISGVSNGCIDVSTKTPLYRGLAAINGLKRNGHIIVLQALYSNGAPYE